VSIKKFSSKEVTGNSYAVIGIGTKGWIVEYIRFPEIIKTFRERAVKSSEMVNKIS
jgi:hypothetical protein